MTQSKSTSSSPSSSNLVFPVPQNIARGAHYNRQLYDELYQQSIDDPEKFWASQAERLQWMQKWDRVKNASFKDDVQIRWFEGGKLNVSANCIDRHLDQRGDQAAIIWEADDPNEPTKKYTYKELSAEVNRLANGLKEMGVKKGDRVTLYMPMVPEAAFAMLACTRIGAVHSVVFGGFSPDSLATRILDCESEFIITADEGVRGGKKIPLKANVDEALKKCPDVKKVLVVKRTGGAIAWTEGRDLWYSETVDRQSTDCPPEVLDSEDPLFILYTSGSTGQPKGVLHTTGGYLLYAAMTHEAVFDYHPGEIYWCTADVGWVTGHSYIVYGPLANGATTLMFEGVPTYPTPSRHWEIVDKYQVNIYYTAPTAIRALMCFGEEPVQKSSRKSLRIIGSVGEPINSEAWLWYYRVVGGERCPIADTWWQTETGGIMIAPLPGAIANKPGSATRPFFGVEPALVDEKGNELTGEAEGMLVIKDSWPGQMRTVYKNHERFVETYFSQFKGWYFTGDGCRRDADGDYWISGRVDDVINVSGHRLGTAEIESALDSHPKVIEAAVVGCPHEVKGQGIYAYIITSPDSEGDDTLKKDLIAWVRKEIGPIASPDHIQWTKALPKTRSGKIMRRILRKIAANEPDQLGDTSTLADPSVVQTLVDERINRS